MLQRHSVPVFYEFVAPKAPSPSSPAHHCIGPKLFVEMYFPQSELQSVMGGWECYVHRVTDEVWLGVWGARKASRFRRILRERGAVFTLEAGRAEDFQLTVAQVSYPH